MLFRSSKFGACSLVGAQDAFGCEARVRCLSVGHVGARECEGRHRFVADMQIHQRLAPRGPALEVGHRIAVERNARKLALHIQRVFFAIYRVVQHGVAVVEDGFFGDRGFTPSPASA